MDCVFYRSVRSHNERYEALKEWARIRERTARIRDAADRASARNYQKSLSTKRWCAVLPTTNSRLGSHPTNIEDAQVLFAPMEAVESGSGHGTRSV